MREYTHRRGPAADGRRILAPLGAAAWVELPGTLPVVVTWLGLIGLVVAVAVFGVIAVGNPER